MTPVIIGMRHRIGVGARSGHERRSLLEDSILTWTRIIREVASRLSATHLIEQMGALQQDQHAAQQWLSDAHLLVIGCRQVDRHLMFLQKLGFRTRRKERAAKQFFDAYNTTDLRELRDLLEHQADYLAGQGRSPKLAVDLTLPLVFLAEADGPERRVSVFGTERRIDQIVAAVAALEAVLHPRVAPSRRGQKAK